MNSAWILEDAQLPPPSQLRQIGHYQVLEVLRQTPERVQFRVLNPHSGTHALLTLLATLRLPTEIPLRDSANILRMRSSDLARFKHQNILSIIDAGECNGIPFVVHDIVEAKPLSDVIVQKGRIGFEDLIKALVRVAAALDAAHARNYYHGALRTDSILIDKNGLSYLGDFGIEYVLHPLKTVRAPGSEEQFTQELAYQAIERLHGPRLDRKGDMYSLGVVAFEALTGQLPYPGSSITSLKDGILNGTRTAATALLPNLREDVDTVFNKVLAIKAASRFDSGHEFVCGLADSLGIEPLTLTFESVEPRRNAAQNTIIKETFTQANPKPGSNFDFAAFDAPPPPRREVKPGNLFDHVRTQLTSKIQFFPRSPLIFMGGCTMFAMAAVCAGILVLSGPSAGPASEVEASEFAALQTVPVSFGLPGIDGLEAPRIAAVPAGVPVDSLNDRQLLGLLWENTASETIMIEALHQAAERNLPELVNASIQPLHHPEAAVRTESARVVAQTGDKRIVPFVMVLLEDVDPLVRREAARALKSLGEKKSLPFLVSRYQAEQNTEVRNMLRSAIDTLNGYPLSEAELTAMSR